jgi:catechol 2,3-dioxygenase-like lactoylglutathione lyase family enzyme
MTDLTKGVTELVLEARDLEASERFYTEVLGLPVVLRWEGPAWKGREAVWVQSGDRTRIGLWKPFTGIAGARPGAHVHFAMTVAEEDYAAAVARARAQGV